MSFKNCEMFIYSVAQWNNSLKCHIALMTSHDLIALDTHSNMDPVHGC